MSCPNCGAQLEMPNQKFCQDCGSMLPDFTKSSDLAQNFVASQETRNYLQLQQKHTKMSNPRTRSKASLVFGIVSIIIAMTTFNAGSSLFMEPYILPLSMRLIIIQSFGILNIVGLVFGIISKIFNTQAKKMESLNKAMKAGNILGIIGLILNSLLAIAAFSLVGIIVV